jgi:hypothetical protein
VDDRLRRLTREVATGDAGARARLLAERLRAGDLGEDRLRLAAHLGDPAAAAALGRELLLPPTITITRWVRGLAEPSRGGAWPVWAREAYVRAAAAAGRIVLPGLDPALAERGRAAVDALDAWVRCPCDEHARSSVEAGNAFPQGPTGVADLFASRGRRFGESTIFSLSGVPMLPAPAALIPWATGG